MRVGGGYRRNNLFHKGDLENSIQSTIRVLSSRVGSCDHAPFYKYSGSSGRDKMRGVVVGCDHLERAEISTAIDLNASAVDEVYWGR